MIRSRALRLQRTAAAAKSTILCSVQRSAPQAASSHALCLLQPSRTRCFSSLFSSRHSGGTLKVVQVKADDALVAEATEEIIEEKRNKSGKRKSTNEPAAASEPVAEPEKAIEETLEQEKKTTKKRSKSSSKSSRAVTQSSSSDSSATDSHKPLSDDGWQVWDDISKPFANAEEQAEFDQWQKILEEEEKKVDAELEEEEKQKSEDADTEDAENIPTPSKPVKERKTKKQVAEPVKKAAAATPEKKASVTAKTDKPRVLGASAETSKKLAAVKADESKKPTSVKAAPAEIDDEEHDDAEEEKSPSTKGVPGVLKSRPVFRDGVHTRMLNVGGEQVMEISGELEDDEDGLLGEEEEEWEDEVDLDAHNPELDASDPETQVGRGVGGVFFTRKDIMELNEKDLIESFTKGSGKGGQKVNKTSSCVHLLHLPTGTRVKCQFSRELQANRARARTIMRQRLEELLLGTESRTAIKQQKERKKKDRNRRRRAKKQAAAEAEKNEHENEEEEHDDAEEAEEEHEAEPKASSKDTKHAPTANRKSSKQQ